MRPLVLFSLLVLSFVYGSTSVTTAHADTIAVPDDYDTIQGAIDAAEDGDVVQVDPDLYQENIDFLGKAIVVESTDGPEDTILDGSLQTLGEDIGSVVSFTSGEGNDSVLRGFTIRNGDGTETVSTAGITVRVGGGIICDGASPTITGNVVTDNVNDGIYTSASEAIITDNVICDNEGSGVNIRDDSDVVVSDCTIERNELSFFGGGVLVDDSTGVVERCTIVDNSATISGGGVFGNLGVLDVIDCEIRDNYASTSGGAVYSDSASTISRCTISSNSAPFGGALSVLEDTTFELCLIESNDGITEGGLIAVLSANTATFDRCTIVNNTSGDDGALVVIGTPFFFYEGTVEFVSSIVWGNDDSGADLFEERDGEVSATYSNIEGGLLGLGNLDEDPVFVDADGGDYRIEEDSPCVDAGDPDAPEDPDLTTADMGAFYFPQLPLFRRGDVDGMGGVSALLDSLFLLEWQFSGGDDPACMDAADVDDSGNVGALLDSLTLLGWAFNSGAAPPAPGPDTCGHDTTDDDLDCETEPDCS